MAGTEGRRDPPAAGAAGNPDLTTAGKQDRQTFGTETKSEVYWLSTMPAGYLLQLKKKLMVWTDWNALQHLWYIFQNSIGAFEPLL